MSATELKEQIEAAKQREEQEKVSVQFAPLQPLLRTVPVDCQVNSVI